MRLLTHNYLVSNVRGTTQGYPLIIEVETLKEETSPVDREKLLRFLPKIDYQALVQAVHGLGLQLDLPPTLPADDDIDDEVAANLHRALFDIHLMEGYLVCPDTGRRFPVKDGIPNMILHEDEL